MAFTIKENILQAPRITPDNYKEIHDEIDTPAGKNISLLNYCAHYGLPYEPAYDSFWIQDNNGTISVAVEEYSGNLERAIEEDEDFVDKAHATLGGIVDNNGGLVEVLWYSGFDRHMYFHIETQ